MVEHSAVNRRVVGSSPTRGANNLVKLAGFFGLKGIKCITLTFYIQKSLIEYI